MNPPRKSPPNRTTHEKEAGPASLDYDHLLRLSLKYWKWITGAVVLGFVGGYLDAASQTAIYEANATILVKEKNADLPHSGDQSYGQTPDLLKTFEQLLQTKDLTERVVKAEHLNENPEFLGKGINGPVSEDDATAMLGNDVAIRIRPMTRLIDITVDHPSPKMAKFLADKLAEQSILQQMDQGGARAGSLSEDLQKEVARLQGQVTQSELALHDYEVAHKTDGASPQDANDVVAQRYKDMNQQYMNAQAQVMLLKERYGESHPKLIEAEKVANELRDEVNKAQNATLNEGSTSIGYEALKTESDSLKLQLSNLLKALRDAQGTANVVDPGIAIAGEADLPRAPVRPSKTKSAAVGGFIGLVVGLGFVFGLYFIDGTIRTVSQAESTLALPVIAAIPILTESDGKSILPTFSDPQSFVAESFRGLRASLLLHDRENPLKMILVGSAIPGEGKSFCAANLAVAFAQAGLRTLLIDADLRLPTLHNYFNVPPDKGNCGFANVLTGKQTLAAAAITSPIPTLDLLLTINPAESPAEMLSGARLPLLLDEVTAKYDRVVIDSAPLNAVSDTMLIMPKADAILLVLRASSTPASESKSALQKISSSKMKPLGLILNYLAPHTLKSYAYGYSYGQKPKDKNAT